MSKKIIDYDDLKLLKHVSHHMGKKAENLIEDAQMLDLKPLLGDEMYHDVVQNMEDTQMVKLLEGGEYDHDGFTYSFLGLKRMLAEFAYARVIMFGTESVSPHGLIEKVNRDGNHVSRERKKEIYTRSRQTAMDIWKDIYSYLCRKSDDYDYWNVYDSDPNELDNFKLTHIR